MTTAVDVTPPIAHAKGPGFEDTELGVKNTSCVHRPLGGCGSATEMSSSCEFSLGLAVRKS